MLRRFSFLVFTLIGLEACQFLSNVRIEGRRETIETRKFLVTAKTQVVGDVAAIHSQTGDTLPDIARHFGLGFNDITAANPRVDVWLPEPGTRILLPASFVLPDAKKRGLVLNLANMRLFHFPDPKTEPGMMETFPVGIGRAGWETPTGGARITYKKKRPSWYVPRSILKEHAEMGDPLPKVVGPGPENPLGEYSLGLSFPRYLLHGTNKPYGVGMRVSHGCVRLYPEDIERLYNKVFVGSSVNIVNQPYLIGWRNNRLYLEVHEPIDAGEKILQRHRKALFKTIEKEATKNNISIDWPKVNRILEQANGVPVSIVPGSGTMEGLLDKAQNIKHPGRFFGQPEIPRLSAADWLLESDNFTKRSDAERLAAVLNHLGPPVPSRVIETNSRYKILAGPMKSPDEAVKTGSRIIRELKLKFNVIHPTYTK